MAYRVYVCDGDHFLLDLYAVKCTDAGHDVSAFRTNEHLLEALREGASPHLIMLDGFGALEVMRTENLAGEAKVIVLSNQGGQADLERARSLGVASYILKASAFPDEVIAEIAMVLGDNVRQRSSFAYA